MLSMTTTSTGPWVAVNFNPNCSSGNAGKRAFNAELAGLQEAVGIDPRLAPHLYYRLIARSMAAT
jgi:hypothetical protein